MSGPAPWVIAAAREQCAADVAAIAPLAGAALWEAECQFVIRSWTEPHRVYHGLRHASEVLTALRELAGQEAALDRHPRLLARVATWYHDIAYDPQATPGSNEQRSATFARDHLHRLGANEGDVDLIEAMILMTQTHEVVDPPRDAATQAMMDAFHDADLWILSSPTQRYLEYARQIRDEYDHVPEHFFVLGRSQVLRHFISREQIYRSTFAQGRWERSARANVGAELARLA